MVLQCLTCIRHLWGQLVCLVKNGFVRPLPDDIIVDILSRLPADCVLECRKVCRQWLAITSTPYFAEMHLKRAAPVLFVQCYGKVLDFYIFDEGAKKNKVIKKMRAGSMHINSKSRPLLYGSCNGLLLFTSPLGRCLRCFVCNPVTGEQITANPPSQAGKFCGFFFHPLTKEYRLLYVRKKVHSSEYCFQYFICSLGGQMWRELGDLSYMPALLIPPAVVNGALHWMVVLKEKNADDIPPCGNSILMFNMDSEVFCFMPHPGSECRSRRSHKKMHLLEMKGQLAFGHSYAKLIDIWVLEDYENWFWLKRYKVNLCWDVRRYPFEETEDSPDYFNADIKLLNIQNDELLMDWFWRGLFRYHLIHNTVRKIDRAGKNMPGMVQYNCNTTAYIKSFISLSGFQ